MNFDSRSSRRGHVEELAELERKKGCERFDLSALALSPRCIKPVCLSPSSFLDSREFKFTCSPTTTATNAIDGAANEHREEQARRSHETNARFH